MIDFNKTMVAQEKDLVKLSLNLFVPPIEEQTAQQVALRWSVVSFTEEKIRLQIYFADHKAISNQSEANTLII